MEIQDTIIVSGEEYNYVAKVLDYPSPNGINGSRVVKLGVYKGTENF